MTITTDTPIALFPWDWIEAVDPSFAELAAIPLSPSLKGFKKEKFESGLAQALGFKTVGLEILEPVAFPSEKSEEKCVVFTFGSVEGFAALLVPRSEIERVLLHLVGHRDPAKVSNDYLDTFWTFAKEELKKAFLQSFQDAPQLEERGAVPIEGPGLRFPLVVTIDEMKVAASLVVSDLFIKSFRDSEWCGASRGDLSERLGKRVEIPFKIVVGKVALGTNDWKSLEIGDTLLLDELTYLPGADKGEGLLYLKEQPVYRVRIKQGAIKIVEPATGVRDLMQQDPEEKEVETSEESLSLSSEEPMPTPEVPLLVRVEMGCFRLPIHQILELRPGNVLKIDVDPKKGVDLVVEGKVIGRGELVTIGDHVGVRVIDLG